MPDIAQAERAFRCHSHQTVELPTGADEPGERVAFAQNRFIMAFTGDTATVRNTGEIGEHTYACEVPSFERSRVFQCSGNYEVLLFDFQRFKYTRASLYSHVDNIARALTIEYGDCKPF